MRTNIYQDQTGELISGLFYTFTILDSSGETVIDRFNGRPGGVQAHLNPSYDELKAQTGHGYFVVKISEQRTYRQTMKWENECGSQNVIDCPHGHVTAQYWKDLEVDLTYGAKAATLIRADMEGQYAMLIGWDFAGQLLNSGLVGYRFAPVLVHSEWLRKWVPDLTVPDLVDLQFTGRRCLRPLSFRDAPDACPHCGREPLVCTACGFEYGLCPQCGKFAFKPFTAKREPGDKSLTVCPYEERNLVIVEGSRWDGSDFIYGRWDDGYPHIITKRALDWLLSVNAAPFYAHPALVNIDGLTPEQRARVLAVKNPVG